MWDPPSDMYLIMMLAKDGRIVMRTGEHLRHVVGLGEMMLEQRQIICFDVFQLNPVRKFIPQNSLQPAS